jgi:cell division protein FtsN
MTSQRGGFAMGLVAGLLIGLALALGVALYITKAPIPFMNKVPQRTAEMDTAEAERNRNWDPNAALGGRTASRAASAAALGTAGATAPAASGALVPPPAAPVALPPVAGASRPAAAPAASAARAAGRDPAAILAGETPPTAARSTAAGSEPFVYFVQAGAFTRNEEAEQQRARLAMMGQGAKITEREQAGRTVYRVRMGPYPTRGEADALQTRLQEQGVEAQLVRVEKP